jgi:hypothetical protein
MTIRKRTKNKWHIRLGDFEFKKAIYHPSGNKIFEVWYKNDFIGDCIVSRSLGGSYLNISEKEKKELPLFVSSMSGVTNSEIHSRNINVIDGRIIETIGSVKVGRLYSTGSKNQFPVNIIYVELWQKELNNLTERKILLEKWPKKSAYKFISPGVYTKEIDWDNTY